MYIMQTYVQLVRADRVRQIKAMVMRGELKLISFCTGEHLLPVVCMIRSGRHCCSGHWWSDGNMLLKLYCMHGCSSCYEPFSGGKMPKPIEKNLELPFSGVSIVLVTAIKLVNLLLI